MCELRKCYTCGIEQPIENFNKSKKEKSGYSYQCKSCKRDELMLSRYGITIDQYNEMFEEQKGCCAICGIHQSEVKKTFSIDHCHKTGKVRGLLCNNCNTGLGLLKDNVESLNKAIWYLQKSNTDKS